MTQTQLRRIPPLTQAQLAAFAGRLNVAVRREVDPYREFADPELDRDFSAMNTRHVELYFRVLGEDRVPTKAELADLADAARRRLHQGVPLESIFHSYRIGTRVLWECLLDVAVDRDLGRLATLTFEFADLVSFAASEGYAQERERRAHSHEEARRLFLARLLSGDVPDEEATAREGRHFGFDLARTYIVALVAPRERTTATNVEQDIELARGRAQIQRYLPDGPALMTNAGLVVAVPVDSALEATSMVRKALAGIGGGERFRIGIGTPRGGPAGIVASYAEAQRALALGSILQPHDLVSRYDELHLFDLFQTGEPVDAFVNEVLGALLRRDRERHSEYARTLDALFADALNRKLAAKRLGVHPNTLSYRIRRIEDLLGGSLYEGEFCFKVQLALKLRPLASSA